MPIFQYKCLDCRSLFEHLMSGSLEVDCVSCSGKNIERSDDVSFYPNKAFCPHDKKIDVNELQFKLDDIMKSEEGRCGGCGTDGAAGSCGTKKKSCGNCACGKGGCGSK